MQALPGLTGAADLPQVIGTPSGTLSVLSLQTAGYSRDPKFFQRFPQTQGYGKTVRVTGSSQEASSSRRSTLNGCLANLRFAGASCQCVAVGLTFRGCSLGKTQPEVYEQPRPTLMPTWLLGEPCLCHGTVKHSRLRGL